VIAGGVLVVTFHVHVQSGQSVGHNIVFACNVSMFWAMFLKEETPSHHAFIGEISMHNILVICVDNDLLL